MFSDKFSSLFIFSALREKLQIPRKCHQIRGSRVLPSSSQMRAALREKQAIHQPNIKEQYTPKPSKNVLISTPPPRTPPKSLQSSKKTLSGVPGVSPEGPESSPRAPRATPERPWEVSGAPPERPRSAQRVQQSSGELTTALWELKSTPAEDSGPRFSMLSGLLLGPPQLVVLHSSPRTQASRGRR